MVLIYIFSGLDMPRKIRVHNWDHKVDSNGDEKKQGYNFFKSGMCHTIITITLTSHGVKEIGIVLVNKYNSSPERHMLMSKIADDNRDEGQNRLCDIKVYF